MTASWLRVVLETDARMAPQVADYLAELGALAVSFDDAKDDPCYEPGPEEFRLWPSTQVTGLFSAEADVATVSEALGRWDQTKQIRSLHVEPLADQVWERVCLDQFQPMEFGQGLWIYPTDHPLPEDSQATVVRMDPGLAFGTGSHATTALCLEYLANAPLQGCRVVDYGCGSGILAIAAALLGAQHVWVADHDPQALYATHENAERNGVADRIEVLAEGEIPNGGVDWVVANILATPLIDLAPHLLALARPGGRLVLSGILAQQQGEVDAAYQHQCRCLQRGLREEWALLAYEVTGS